MPPERQSKKRGGNNAINRCEGGIKMNNLQIVRRFKFSQFDTGWAVVDAGGEVQAFFDDVEGAPDAALMAARDWVQNNEN